jgi:hypothetical protein
VRYDGVIANFPIAEARMVEFDVSGSWYIVEVALRVQEISCHLSGRTFSTQNALSHTFTAKFTHKTTWIVRRIGLLIEGFVDCNHLLLIIFEEVCAGCAVRCEARMFAGVEAGLNIEYKIGDFLGSLLEDLITVDDSVL